MSKQDHETQFVSAVSDAIRSGAIANKGGNAFAFESNGHRIEIAFVPKVPKAVLQYLRIDGDDAPALSDASVEAISAAVDAAIASNRLSKQFQENAAKFSMFTEKITKA